MASFYPSNNTNNNNNESNEPNQPELSKIDELLQTGQISNAVEFYNYFKNKSNTTTSPLPQQQYSYNPVSTCLTVSTLSAFNTTSSPPLPTSSSSSSLSSYSTVSNQTIPQNKRNTHSGTNTSKKTNKTNTLNDYANLLQTSNQQSQQHNFNTKPRCKKTSSSSSLAIYANPSLPSILSTSTLSIPSNLYTLNTNCINNPSSNQQFLAYALSSNQSMGLPCSNRRPVTIQSVPTTITPTTTINPAIFDEYLIENRNVKTDTDAAANQLDSYQNSKSTSISSMFLNSANSYYQKYRQQQRLQHNQNQQQPQHFSISNPSNNNYLMVDDKYQQQDLEKRKEDAINRIIRNERIKEIRLKIYEYELLKEYQNLNQNLATNLITSQEESFNYNFNQDSKSDDYATHNDNLSEELNNNDNRTETSSLEQDYSASRSVKSNKNKKSINNYFSRTYGSSNNRPHSEDSNTSSTIKTVFDEYKSENTIEPVSLVYYDDDEYYENDEDNEDNYESGIEDEDGSFSMSNINRNKQKQQRIKPGYELYQISTSSSNSNNNAGFGFGSIGLGLSSIQSKFLLKISIISAEVKNIVNVLKQVRNFIKKKFYN